MKTAPASKMLSILFIGLFSISLLSGFSLPASLSAAAIDSLPDIKPAVNFQAEATPTPGEEVETATRYFMQFDDISFYYISTVASKVTAKTVEKSLNVNNLINPKMDQFEFQNYAVPSLIKPRINIFPVQEFKDQGGDSVTRQIEKLKQLTANQPANPPGELPMLLGEPAVQLMRARLEYVKFQNGAGVRYVAQYAEQPWPYDNNLLFYTFQGLTDDGGYFISVVLPVNHATLEGDDGFARVQEDYAKFQANYPAYVDYIQKQLNTEQPNSFTPNLASLDAMIKSMVIEKKAPAAGKPTSQPTATVTNSPAGCTNEAAFVADITVPDDTSFPPGATFKKTWRLKNIGTCTWTPDYRLIFSSGDAMGAPAASKLTNASVPPNGNLDVSVSLTSPENEGTYQGFFKMRAPGGAVFGIQPNGSNAFWVLINVVPPSQEETTAKPLIPIKPKLTLVPLQP